MVTYYTVAALKNSKNKLFTVTNDNKNIEVSENKIVQRQNKEGFRK